MRSILAKLFVLVTCLVLFTLAESRAAVGGVVGGTPPPNITERVIYVNRGQSLTAARDRADAANVPTTIIVGPGDYVAHDLWRPLVSWHGMPGANLSWSDVGDGIGLWDDRTGGAATNTIVWKGRLSYHCDEPLDLGAAGAFVFTNENSWLVADVAYVSIEVEDGGAGAKGAAFCIKNCRKAMITAQDIVDANIASYGSGLYWETGDTHFDFQRMRMSNGYGIWCQEPAGTPSTDLYSRGQFVSVDAGIGVPTCVRFTGTNSSYRAWLEILELQNLANNSYALGMDGSGGRLYYKGQKVGSATSAIQIAGGTGWFEIDKVSAALGNWVTATGGESHWSVRHWEDATTNLNAGWKLTGGRHNFGPGYASILNGKGIEHFAGTNRFTGLTIDTRGTNTSTSVTNNRPVTVANGASNLVLNSCVLLSPIATANGGAYSIFCTNASVAHVIFGGTTVCNSNTAGIIPVVAALLTTNQSQLR